jgi:hypothetical protein
MKEINLKPKPQKIRKIKGMNWSTSLSLSLPSALPRFFSTAPPPTFQIPSLPLEDSNLDS